MNTHDQYLRAQEPTGSPKLNQLHLPCGVKFLEPEPEVSGKVVFGLLMSAEGKV